MRRRFFNWEAAFISILLSIAHSVLMTVPSASASETLQIVNGNFSPSGEGWYGARYSGVGNDACLGGSPNIGTWEPSTLAFSYVESTVWQKIVVPEPTSLKLFFTIKNRGDQPGATFTASFGGTTTGKIVPSTIETLVELSFVTTFRNQEVLISFSGRDQTYWAGCYGTYVTNVFLASDNKNSSGESYTTLSIIQNTPPKLSRQGDLLVCKSGDAVLLGSGISRHTITGQSLNFYIFDQNKFLAMASSDNFYNLSHGFLLGPEDLPPSPMDAHFGVADRFSASWRIESLKMNSLDTLRCVTALFHEHAVLISTADYNPKI